MTAATSENPLQRWSLRRAIDSRARLYWALSLGSIPVAVGLGLVFYLVGLTDLVLLTVILLAVVQLLVRLRYRSSLLAAAAAYYWMTVHGLIDEEGRLNEARPATDSGQQRTPGEEAIVAAFIDAASRDVQHRDFARPFLTVARSPDTPLARDEVRVHPSSRWTRMFLVPLALVGGILVFLAALSAVMAFARSI